MPLLDQRHGNVRVRTEYMLNLIQGHGGIVGSTGYRYPLEKKENAEEQRHTFYQTLANECYRNALKVGEELKNQKHTLHFLLSRLYLFIRF